MDNKSVDGIKKLSGEELEKARKIVLDSIGETDKRKTGKKESGSPLFAGKRLDGISPGAARPAVKKDIAATEEKIAAPSAPLQPAVIKKSLANGIAQIEKTAEEAGAKGQKSALPASAVRERAGEKATDRPLPSERGESPKQKKKKNKAEEKSKKKEEEKKKEIKEEKKKEAAEKIKIEKEKTRREIREIKERKKLARQIWLARKKKKLSKLMGKLWESFCLAGKILIFSFVFFVVSATLLYLVFSFLLLKFNLDNEISRRITIYAPVPAVVTKIGFVDYYDYKKIISELGQESSNREELEPAARKAFIEKISLERLLKKYGISFAGRQMEEVEEEINARLAADKKLNEISYSRINKIKELVEAPQTGESFEEIGEKYGDGQGYIGQDNEFLRLAEKVRRLESGQISEIIITDRGYYIVKKENERLKYIFVKSITLDEYLEKMLSELRVWVLAD
ncbi:MAG: hypothetical protein PHQ42_04870 [Patescibacteria group bacterium]|nr:hypothetical protein [Patescibacteria group bacterium]